MEINDKLIEKLSQLAALSLNGEEKAEMRKYLKDTLSYFEKIKQIDTSNTEALSNPLNPSLSLRSDEVKDFSCKDKILEQFPDKQGFLVKVPSIL